MPPVDSLLWWASAACAAALGGAGLALLGRRFLRGGDSAGGAAGLALLAGGVALAVASRGASPAMIRPVLLAILASSALAVLPEPERPLPRTSAVFGAAALAAAAAFLAIRLFDPTLPERALFTWERAGLWGFEQEMMAAPALVRALESRLLWQPGLLSTGGDSLLYGFPTLVLLERAPASVLLLRLAAALLALVSVFLAWAVSRSILGDAPAAATVWMWLAAPAFVAYAFYGTSVTATWVSLWLALGAVHRVVTRPTAGAALLAAGALYLATLQYAPGRLAATGLLLAALGALAFGGAREGRGRAIAVLAAAAAALVAVNVRSGHGFTFYAARGENLIVMRTTPEVFTARVGRPVPPGPLGWSDTLSLSRVLVAENAPAFAGIVAPVNALEPSSPRTSSDDPPHVPLLFAAALPLVVWGFVLSVRRGAGARRTGAVFAVAALLAVGPLFFTNRIDVGRAGFLLPFLALWGGLGGADLASRLAHAWPRGVAATIGIVFFAGLLLQDHALGLDAPLRRSPLAQALLPEVLSTPGPVRIVSREEETDAAWLEALGRLRSRPALLPAVVGAAVTERLLDGSDEPARAVEVAAALARDTALLLAPASDFSTLRREAGAHGLQASIGGTADIPVLRLERAAGQ